MQPSSTPSYRCPFCHERVEVSGYRELAVTLVTLPDQSKQRIVEVDGIEVHRCPFSRKRYEAVARERATRLVRTRDGGLRIVNEPQLRLNWYRDG